MLEKIEEINKSRFIHWESAASVISEKISKAGDEERRKMYDESPYYDISRVAVVRSDERIFSLVSTDESYTGEEERFTVQTANIDPVTGEEVDFNDLCTNRERLLQFAEKAAVDHFSGDGISDNNETEKFMTEFNVMLSSGNVPFVIGNGGIGFYFGGQKPWSFFVDFSDGENRELYKSIFSKAYGMGAESYSIKLKEDIPYNVLFANDGKNGNVQFSLNQAYKDGILMVEKVILYADGREKAELEPVDADTVNAKLIVDPSGVYVCLTFTTPYESDGDGSFQRVYRIDGNSISYEDSLQVKNACDTVDLSDYPGFTEGADIHVDIMDDSGLH